MDESLRGLIDHIFMAVEAAAERAGVTLTPEHKLIVTIDAYVDFLASAAAKNQKNASSQINLIWPKGKP